MSPDGAAWLAAVLLTIAPTVVAQEWWVESGAAGTALGTPQAPWHDLTTALQQRQLKAGDTIVLRPGIYRTNSTWWITTAGIRLTRDPTTSGRVILDGGVSYDELCNHNADGTPKLRDNGPRLTKVLGVVESAADVTIDGLEVRNGYVGIFTEAPRTRILGCHVHDTAQNGISCTGNNVEIAYNVVHDVVLYNINGQCLAKLRLADGSPDQNTRNRIVKADGTLGGNMDWGQGITCHGDYPRSTATNFTKIVRDGFVHDNVLWNAWSEGFGTYCSISTTMACNTAFNIWRAGYYAQNADQAVLDGNLSAFHDHFDAWALRNNYSVANELDRYYYQAAHPTDTFLLPDSSGVTVRNSIALGGSSGMCSVFGAPLNTQSQQVLTFSGNLIADPPTGIPCLETGPALRGMVRVTGNAFLKNADPAVLTNFFRHRDAAGVSPPLAWTISANHCARLPTSWATITAQVESLVTASQGFALLSDTDDSEPWLTTLRSRVATLRQTTESLRAAQLLSSNTAPRILRTSARTTHLDP